MLLAAFLAPQRSSAPDEGYRRNRCRSDELTQLGPADQIAVSDEYRYADAIQNSSERNAIRNLNVFFDRARPQHPLNMLKEVRYRFFSPALSFGLQY